MARLLITGAAGMLGTALVSHLAAHHHITATDRTRGYAPLGVDWRLLDLDDRPGITKLVRATDPDVLIHTAAVVDVDGCERDPDRATRVHVDATATIADAATSVGASLLYISTDSVFDGEKAQPYTEDDAPHPLNMYARTKLLGEQAALSIASGTVLRTNIFGWSRAERQSFAEWVLRGLVDGRPLGMFADVRFTPIHVSHLASLIEQVIARQLSGLYHAGGGTALSKLDFALAMSGAFGLSTSNVGVRQLSDATLSAPRPRNTSLSSRRLADLLGCSIPTCADGIQLMKHEYDSGWLAHVKGRPIAGGYRYWENA